MCGLNKLNHPSPPAGTDGAAGAVGTVGTAGVAAGTDGRDRRDGRDGRDGRASDSSPSRLYLSHPLQALRDLDLLLSDRGDPRSSGWTVAEIVSICCTCIISHCKWVITGESLCSGWSGTLSSNSLS